jgi:hypothetical protein
VLIVGGRDRDDHDPLGLPRCVPVQRNAIRSDGVVGTGQMGTRCFTSGTPVYVELRKHGLAPEDCLLRAPAEAHGKKPFLDREPPVSTAIKPSKRGWAAILTPDSRISAPLAVPGAWRGSEASGNLGPERTGLMANEKDCRLRLPYF